MNTPTPEPAKTYKLGRFIAATSENVQYRLAMFLWGKPGCGKTVWAQTAPGKKLWISFDLDGTASLKKRDDTIVIDLGQENPSIVNEFSAVGQGLCLEIERMLKDNPDIETVVVDSVTAFQAQAVRYAVANKVPGATHDNPGPGGYGVRNRQTLSMANNLAVITAKHMRHIIFIGHEDVPKTDDKGLIVAITILLGGSLAAEVPSQLSEVWNMRDVAKKRMVTVRNAGVLAPMKTRMFDASSSVEFTNTYNQADDTGLKISDLYNAWRDNGFQKIKLPS